MSHIPNAACHSSLKQIKETTKMELKEPMLTRLGWKETNMRPDSYHTVQLFVLENRSHSSYDEYLSLLFP